MPFKDSEVMRPLYDTTGTDRAGPSAWRCILMDVKKHPARRYGSNCGRVCRTLVGMRLHQFRVHGFRPQKEIDFETTSHQQD